MRNPSKNVGSQALAGLILGLFLTGPVFGNEAVSAPGIPPAVESAPLAKDSVKAEKGSKKRGHRKHRKSAKKQTESQSSAKEPVSLDNSQK